MDPFAQMHAQMNAQMRRMQEEMMFGMPMGGGGARDDHYGMNGSPARDGTGVQIEEVHEDGSSARPTRQQPIVEEPDDPQQAAAARQQHRQRQYDAQMRAHEERQQQQRAQQRQHEMQMQMHPFGFPAGGMFGQMMNFPYMYMAGPSGASSSYSYSSSTSFSSSSGPNGVTYQETKTSRRGPGGIMEETHTVRDGRTGQEKLKMTRGLGERQRTLEQERRNGENMQRVEHLQGFQSVDEATNFDAEWQSRAVNGLMPGLGDGFGRSGGQQARIETPALGFGNYAALNGAMHGAGRQADRHRSHPRPSGQYEQQHACQDGFQDPRFRQI